MNSDLNTVFVLGAGFSVEQGYPLVSTMPYIDIIVIVSVIGFAIVLIAAYLLKRPDPK